MPVTLTILGSNSAMPTSERFTSAHVLNVHEHLFLIDCGEATQIRFRQLKLRFNKLNHIFISHLHGDHYFGIFGLISTFQMLGRKNDLHIFSFKELKSIINKTLNTFNEELSFKIVFHDLNANGYNLIFNDKNVEVYSFPLNHRVPTCGFILRETHNKLNIKKEVISKYKLNVEQINDIKNGNDLIINESNIIPNAELTLPLKNCASYAYCSDTLFSEQYIEYLKNVNVLYHEATFCEEHKDRAKSTNHSTSKQAAEVALKANVNKLIIGHFSARYKNLSKLHNEAKSIFKETYLAFDGEVFEIN